MSQFARSLHVPTRMSGQRLWTAALLGSLWLLAAGASAQGTAGTSGSTAAGGIGITPISIGDVTASTIGKVYLNASQCKSKAALVFQLNGLNSGKSAIDIWIGEGCNSQGNRSVTTTTACRYVKTVPTMNQTQKFMVTLQADEVILDCAVATETTPKIWFLNVGSPPKSPEDVSTDYALFDRLNVDTQPPPAPSSLTGGEGGSVISISWKSGATNLQGFVVLIDTNGTSGSSGTTDTGNGGNAIDASTAAAPGEDGGSLDAAAPLDAGVTPRVSLSDSGTVTTSNNGLCGPTILAAGASPDDLPGAVYRKRVNERTASGVDLTPSDLKGDKKASIAVSAVDLAGNEGPMSNIACVRVVPTSGFIERYRANGGTAVAGCPCSAMGPVHAEQAWPVGLAVLALGLSARRRRSW